MITGPELVLINQEQASHHSLWHMESRFHNKSFFSYQPPDI
jgi:hypothetical protein